MKSHVKRKRTSSGLIRADCQNCGNWWFEYPRGESGTCACAGIPPTTTRIKLPVGQLIGLVIILMFPGCAYLQSIDPATIEEVDSVVETVGMVAAPLAGPTAPIVLIGSSIVAALLGGWALHKRRKRLKRP